MCAVTYRASLENYTTSGNILGIGLLVCVGCKERHLKGVDFGKRSDHKTKEDAADASKAKCGEIEEKATTDRRK